MEVQGSAEPEPAPAPAPTASPQPAPAVAAPGEARAADFSPVATAAGAGAAAAGVGGEKSSPSPAPVMSSGGGVGGPYGAGMMSLGSSVSMMAGSGGGDDLTPKKRGRPRKYSPDGSGMALALCPTPSEFSSGGAKRGRGRPPGSGRRQLLSALGGWFAYSAGGSFTPHVVAISTGEDVAARILSFSQKGPRSICVLSANGAISNVTLRQPGSSGGTLTYEGRFEILSLSGSYTMIDNGGVRSRTGGISVSLAGPDGRVVGGGVAGSLIAASPIQVVVGSFVPNALKEQKKKPNPESLTYPITPTSTGSFTAGRPTSQAVPGNECVTPTVAALPWKNHDLVGNSANSTPDLNCTSFKPSAWQGLEASSEHKASPDINICLHGD